MKKLYLMAMSVLFLLLTAVDCEEVEKYEYYVNNSSNDTIAVVYHLNYPDTVAYYDGLVSSMATIVPPNQIGMVTTGYSYVEGDYQFQLGHGYGQITIFPISSYHAAGGFENLYTYPSLGRFSFTSASTDEKALGTTFYFPPTTEPSVKSWIDPWKRWRALGGFMEGMPAWDDKVPLFKWTCSKDSI